MNPIKASLPLLFLLAAGPALSAEYSLAVEPSYPADQADEIYKPLSDYLSKATGHTFSIVSSRNYHFYWREMRQNTDLDFVFEEAHFTDFRARRFGFTPLARKTEPTSYAILASAEHSERGIEGLVGRRIVTMPSPSLGFALLAEFFTNPVSQPEFRSEASSWHDGVQMVFAGDAEAAMMPEHIAQQYPNLVEVARSREFPGTTVSAAPGVPEEVKQAVRDALLNMHQDEEAYGVLVEIGASGFEPAAAEDYADAERVLRGFFGYREFTGTESDSPETESP